MRSFAFASAIIGLASALPAPQDIDFDLAYALPNPTYSEAVGVASQIITYNPTTVYSAALDQITASITNTSAAVIATTDAASNEKRDVCSSQPLGSGPVPTPDTASAFLNYPAFAASASAAPIPSGYTQEFVNLNGSSSAYGYLGYTTLTSYDVNTCAAKCNAINGCISINIYFERDPTVDPGTGDSGCANPPSTTNIKCVFWGGPVGANNANNYGQYRNQFHVVIAGSNGYTNSSVAAIPGYSTAVPLGNAAINAPYDSLGYDTYLGAAIFTGIFNAELCAQACTEKSQYAIANPPTDGTPVATCQFFNTYILYINTTSDIQGQYCAMYAESWGASYATNVGQYRGHDDFLIEYSFTYSNATNPGSPNALAAVYQARNDIEWPANSALPYCSSILGYSIPTSTQTATVTYTPLGTTTQTTIQTDYTSTTETQYTTQYTTVTTFIYQKRDAYSTSATSMTVINGSTVPALPAMPTLTTQTTQTNQTTYTNQTTQTNQKRTVSIPNVLTKYPASIITSACSLAVSPATSTNVITSTVTQTVNTAYSTQEVDVITTITSTVVDSPTTTVTSVVSSTTAGYNFVVVGGTYDGQYVGTDDPPGESVVSYGFVYLTDAAEAACWTIESDGSVYECGTTYAWRTAPPQDGSYYILDISDYANESYGISTVKCSIGTGNAPSSVSGAQGLLTCSSDTLIACSSVRQVDGEVDLLQVPTSQLSSIEENCIVLSIAAVPIS